MAAALRRGRRVGHRLQQRPAERAGQHLLNSQGSSSLVSGGCQERVPLGHADPDTVRLRCARIELRATGATAASSHSGPDPGQPAIERLRLRAGDDADLGCVPRSDRQALRRSRRFRRCGRLYRLVQRANEASQRHRADERATPLLCLPRGLGRLRPRLFSQETQRAVLCGEGRAARRALFPPVRRLQTALQAPSTVLQLGDARGR